MAALVGMSAGDPFNPKLAEQALAAPIAQGLASVGAPPQQYLEMDDEEE